MLFSEGEIFGENSLDAAKACAYWRAWAKSCVMDGKNLATGAHYPTHGYRLYHRTAVKGEEAMRGDLIVEYKPPNPDDVVSGKVQMPAARDIIRQCRQ